MKSQTWRESGTESQRISSGDGRVALKKGENFMSKLLKGFLLGIVATFLVAGSAMASPFGADNGVELQGILDNITTAPTAGASSIDVTTDMLSDASDSYWSVGATGGSVSTMIIEVAGFAQNNMFGIYNSGQYVQLFNGSATNGDQALLSIKEDGSVYVNFADTGVDFSGNVFGFYINNIVDSGSGLFHSDSSLNENGVDHMLAYQGLDTDFVKLPTLAAGLWTDNEYILAFEDLYGGGDLDYTDMVLMVESVNPVPEPATMLLFGMGLLGLAGVTRRKINA